MGLFLEVQQARQTSIRVVKAYSGFHSSRCRETGLQVFSEKPERKIFERESFGEIENPGR